MNLDTNLPDLKSTNNVYYLTKLLGRKTESRIKMNDKKIEVPDRNTHKLLDRAKGRIRKTRAKKITLPDRGTDSFKIFDPL